VTTAHTFYAQLQRPERIAFDSKGNTYAAAQQQNDVKKYVKN